MAKTQAPLFGFGASGKLGDAIVFGKWKGIDVARKYVVPANPQSSAQTVQRGYMEAAVDAWHNGTTVQNALDKAAWNRFAGIAATPRSGFNQFCKYFVDGRVAGQDANWFFGGVNAATTATAFDAQIDDTEGGTLTVTRYFGVSPTFFDVSATDAAASGLTSFAAYNTGLPAGTRVYWYFEVVGQTPDNKRSGIYSAVLT